eukprot:jgi/Mesen1/2642/ME000166S01767
MYGSTGQYPSKSGYADIETGYGDAGPSLYPQASDDENMLRWGFIRKVYGILCIQVLLTLGVVLVVINSTPVKSFVLASPGSLIVVAIFPFILLCALSAYHRSHPTNLILLALFTVSLSLTIGLACAFSEGTIVLEALVLTAAVVIGLTAYTFWAARQGYDFHFLGPMLFVALMCLCLWGFIQAFFPFGRTGHFVYSLIGAILFSVYIVYDTDNLIKRYDYDDYIWASVALYLDIVNLFLHLLNLLKNLQGGGGE